MITFIREVETFETLVHIINGVLCQNCSEHGHLSSSPKIMMSVIMLTVIMLNVIMLSVIMLTVIMPSVLAPCNLVV